MEIGSVLFFDTVTQYWDSLIPKYFANLCHVWYTKRWVLWLICKTKAKLRLTEPRPDGNGPVSSVGISLKPNLRDSPFRKANRSLTCEMNGLHLVPTTKLSSSEWAQVDKTLFSVTWCGWTIRTISCFDCCINCRNNSIESWVRVSKILRNHQMKLLTFWIQQFKIMSDLLTEFCQL